MQQIRGLVGHQELRAVGGAQNQRALHARSRATTTASSRRNVARVEQAADLAFEACRRNGRLHRDRQTEQPTAPMICGCGIHRSRLRPHAFCVEVGERIQLWIRAARSGGCALRRAPTTETSPARSSSSCRTAGASTSSDSVAPISCLPRPNLRSARSSAGVDVPKHLDSRTDTTAPDSPESKRVFQFNW